MEYVDNMGTTWNNMVCDSVRYDVCKKITWYQNPPMDGVRTARGNSQSERSDAVNDRKRGGRHALGGQYVGYTEDQVVSSEKYARKSQ